MSDANYRQAIDTFKKVMKMTIPDSVIWNDIALCHLYLREDEECEKALRSAIELDPEYTEGLHNLSLVLFDRQEYKESEWMAQRAVEVDSTLGISWWSLGRALYYQEKYEDALKGLATSIGLIPDHADSHLLLGQTLGRLGKLEKAERSFIRATELAPEDGRVLREYGEFLIFLERYADAEKYLKRAIEEDSYDYMALTSLAESYIQRIKEKEPEPEGRDFAKEAMETLNASLELEVRYGKTWFHWGEMFLFFRNWEGCESSFRTSIELDYNDLNAYPFLAGALTELGKHEEAEEVFRKYKEIIGDPSTDPWNKDYVEGNMDDSS